MGPSDAELVARVLATDDRHAFAEIVRRHQSLVRALLRRLTCGDTALADDLAQDTFLRAYRGLARYQGTAKLSSWLYRIAYNVFLSHKERRGAPVGSEVGGEAVEVGSDERAALRQDLDRAMGFLSPSERAAITLSYREGASHGEVAEILECPVGTVKTHIARGKEKLEKHLRAWGPEG